MGESGKGGEEGVVEGGVGGDVVVRTRVGNGKGNGKCKEKGDGGRTKARGASASVGGGRGNNKRKGQVLGSTNESATGAGTGTGTSTGKGAGETADVGAVVAMNENEGEDQEEDDEDEDDDEEDEREFLIGHLQNPLRTRRALEAMQVRASTVFCLLSYHSILFASISLPICTVVSPLVPISFSLFLNLHLLFTLSVPPHYHVS